jgi:hypothetical protein
MLPDLFTTGPQYLWFTLPEAPPQGLCLENSLLSDTPSRVAYLTVHTRKVPLRLHVSVPCGRSAMLFLLEVLLDTGNKRIN